MKDVSSFLQSALCQTRPRFSFSSLMLYFFPPPCIQKETKAFILTLRDKDFHYIKNDFNSERNFYLQLKQKQTSDLKKQTLFTIKIKSEYKINALKVRKNTSLIKEGCALKSLALQKLPKTCSSWSLSKSH